MDWTYIEVRIREKSEINTIWAEDNIQCLLNPNDELSAIRKCLEKEEIINMGTNMYFMSGDSTIQLKNESGRRLSGILVGGQILNLLRYSRQPDWIAIIKERKLEYGINFTRNGPVHAKKKAFHITKVKNLRLGDQQGMYDFSQIPKNALEQMLMENLLSKSIDQNCLYVIFDSIFV